tara:strand:+ start:1073 stop:2011 length:939 start_codon:yes stop_codon:yes gene_type:complete
MGIKFIFCTKKSRDINYRINIFKKGLDVCNSLFKNSKLNKKLIFVLGNNSIVDDKPFNSNQDYKKNYICLGSSPYQNMGLIKNLSKEKKAHNLILFGSNRYDKLVDNFKNISGKWNEFKLKYNIFEEDYRINQKGFILLTLSNAIGWFGQHKEKNWINNVKVIIKKIEKKTSRKIVIRLHPNNINHSENLERKCPGFKKLIKKLKKKYEFNNTQPLIEIKDKIYAAIVVNGSICVELTCYGIPIFCFDKNFDKFMCSKIALSDINLLNDLKLENLNNSKKREFLEWICSNCFFREEIENGYLFKKIYEIVSS